MPKSQVISLDKTLLKKQLQKLKYLLDVQGVGDLGERRHILPLFAANPQLCAFMGMYNPNIVDFARICVENECSIFGDHVADLVIGDKKNRQFCFIEFEDAASTSIFATKAKKSTPEWSRRYEHGFSQLIDWILWIENNRNNVAYKNRFGSDSIQYNMLLVIGRDRDLVDPALRERFEWRHDSVVVASKKVHCITYDKLYEDLNTRLQILG